MAKEVDQAEETRRKFAEKAANDARQQELDRRDAMRKAQAKVTHPHQPLVTSE